MIDCVWYTRMTQCDDTHCHHILSSHSITTHTLPSHSIITLYHRSLSQTLLSRTHTLPHTHTLSRTHTRVCDTHTQGAASAIFIYFCTVDTNAHSRVPHVTLRNDSCHTYKWVKSRLWISYVSLMNESCHTYANACGPDSIFTLTHSHTYTHIHTHTHTLTATQKVRERQESSRKVGG